MEFEKDLGELKNIYAPSEQTDIPAFSIQTPNECELPSLEIPELSGEEALDIPDLQNLTQELDIDTYIEKVQTEMKRLGLNEDEIEHFSEVLQENRTPPTMYRSFGSNYGGYVCWGGSINCSSCQGVLQGKGLCRNG